MNRPLRQFQAGTGKLSVLAWGYDRRSRAHRFIYLLTDPAAKSGSRQCQNNAVLLRKDCQLGGDGVEI